MILNFNKHYVYIITQHIFEERRQEQKQEQKQK